MIEMKPDHFTHLVIDRFYFYCQYEMNSMKNIIE